MLTNAHVWREARERLRPQMTRAQFDTWLRGTRLITLEQSAAVLAVPTTFAKELLESQYRARIEAALAAVTGRSFTLRVVVASDRAQSPQDADEGTVPGVSVRARVASRPLSPTREQHKQPGKLAGQGKPVSYAHSRLFDEGFVDTDNSHPTASAEASTSETPRTGARDQRAESRAESGSAGTALHSAGESGERSVRMTREHSPQDEDRRDANYPFGRGGSESQPRQEDGSHGPAYPPLPSASGTHPLHSSAASRSGGPAPRLNPRYTFKTFIVGSSNQLAYAASIAVGEAPGQAYNPLFLYGGVGLGKTHLLHAVGHAAQAQGLAVLYVTSETFTNEIVNAIRYRTTEEFREKYRTADVLLVDDIQFIAGKDSTEEEFFHTFNSLYESGRQIVICSDHPPKAIVSLEERLRSRFEWGLIADVQPPDFGTRVAILRAKAEMMQRQVPDDVIDYLADRIQSNIRELEGSLNRLLAFSALQRTPLTVDVAKAALATLASDARVRRISIAEVLAAVSEFYRISPDDLRGKQRDKHIVVPRQVAMYLMRQETEASLLEIGQALGGRDHSTVLHGYDKIGKEINENTALRKEIVTIRQRLQG